MPFTVFNSHLIFIWTCTSKRGGQKVLAIKMHTNCLILNVPFFADFAVRAFLKITFLQGGNCFIYNLFWPLDTQTMQYLYKNNLFFVQSPSQTTNWKPKRDCFYLFFLFFSFHFLFFLFLYVGKAKEKMSNVTEEICNCTTNLCIKYYWCI